MKVITKLSLSLATLLTLSSSTLYAEENLITNGNFEQIVGKFQGVENGEVRTLKVWNSDIKIWKTVDEINAIRGDYMIELDTDENTNKISQLITTTLGKKYKVKLRAFAREKDSSSFRISLGDDSIFSVTPDENVTEYSKIFDGTGEVNATFYIAEFSKQRTGKGAVIDDVSVIELDYKPTVDIGLDQVVEVGTTLNFKGIASDVDGEIVSYEWKNDLETLAYTADYTYITTEVGRETLSLTVMDENNNYTTDTVFLDIRAKDISDCNDKNISERRVILQDGIYALTFSTFLLEGNSTMSYCENEVDEFGAIFKLKYNDTGKDVGSTMDGYPSGTIGGVASGKDWIIGDKSQTGMPVQLSELGIEEKIIVEWQVSQENAYDADDKWHATINCIFDLEEDTKPSATNRDYDLVIQSDSHNTEDGFYDDDNLGENNETRAHYYAKKDGKILPFTIKIDREKYRYAVRYKIFHTGIKDNKIHVKYTPLDKENTPRKFKYDIQKFIQNSIEYVEYTDLKNQGTVAYEGYKDALAKDSLYLKSISAGYEVYEGNSILKNDIFKVKLRTIE